jgi:hypothetical protein
MREGTGGPARAIWNQPKWLGKGMTQPQVKSRPHAHLDLPQTLPHEAGGGEGGQHGSLLTHDKEGLAPHHLDAAFSSVSALLSGLLPCADHPQPHCPQAKLCPLLPEPSVHG